ncbi:oligosaccharide flippase family protein [Bradyrhizobium sp. JYMT SZCCT0180]|uniref:oligosaccharide flippase family protein n=1 Tax=Bradyrhizobium sp. JYMT SZCCT0180 TaxID=2807666 RepID=UPI001BA50FD5|nr:oligosaccharide flippase family protein [Bradyrhizobium sp. JYMT SZCCT0180]MBR1213946.1 oligosaccharide flippase family protein [Bradyrhizobium sp. JYMT SZCCT0180]
MHSETQVSAGGTPVFGGQDGIYVRPRLRRALCIHISARTVNLILGLGFQVLVVKMLPVGDYATYAVLLATMMLAQNILSFGVDRTVYRFVPDLTLRGERGQLLALYLGIGAARVVGITLFLIGIQYGVLEWFTSERLTPTTLVAFTVWFIATSTFGDVDALAQTWVAHSRLAIATTAEIVSRFAMVVVLLAMGYAANAELIVVISAATALLALATIAILLVPTVTALSRSQVAADTNMPVDVKQAPRFAATIYLALYAWVVSSPSVVRLVAATGLDVLALAGFSFAQNFVGSLQRGLPGTLMLPALEPVIMANLAQGVPREKLFAPLSLVYKLDLVCNLALVIATSVAGGAIVRLLATPTYAEFFFVLPVLAAMMAINASYRIFEIVGNLNLNQRVFLLLSPLGLASAGAIYLTIGRYGIWSVLAFPLIESAARFCIFLFVYRRDVVGRAIDLVRMFEFILISLLVVLAGLTVKALIGVASDGAALAVACGCVAAMIGAILLLRPLRAAERDVALSMIPESWSWPRNVTVWLTR